MKKNEVEHVVIHITDDLNWNVLEDVVSKFHVEAVRRRLTESKLSQRQRVAVIDRMIREITQREKA